ncbi:MAG: transglutaminase-like domain-containing protein [Coriobacteriales bacterium]|jgi:hypothetical protein|nr:transglutaminase-like domain-containing protein [Coriobacteriales bacterium]
MTALRHDTERGLRGIVVLLALIAALLLVFLVGSTLSSCTLLDDGGDLDSAVSADSEERANPGVPRDNVPVVRVAEQPGAAVASDDKAVLDYSNAALGYVCALSLVDGVELMVLVDGPLGGQYQYSIPTKDSYITIPLSEGNGIYAITVYENLYDDTYSPLFSQDLDVALSDEFGPFLYPNPTVNFAAGDAAVQLSQEVTANATSEVEAVDQIYMYLVENFVYDYDKAASVAPGYLPNNDNMLAAGKGICYDFASLAASLLRAQRLPTKLDVGYCGATFHAWIEVYTEEQGWVRKKIEFPGRAWTLMDPTFDSASRGTGDIDKIVGDGSDYQPMRYY